MKVINPFICLAMLFSIFWTCKPKETVQPENLLQTCRIIPDSVNVKMKWGESVTVKTDKGDLIVRFKHFSEACIYDCKGCDNDGALFIELEFTKKEIKEFPKIEVSRCENYLPPLIFGFDYEKNYEYLCGLNRTEIIQFAHASLAYGNLLLAVREISPYPKTREEVLSLFNQKNYFLDLIIKNKCK